MRADFARVMVELHDKHPNFIMLTADLGYMALEKVRDKYQDRFINAGVAEQNLISLAAGLAYEGFVPWVYNIAPFGVLRPYEQIRNDVCLHNLPVKIIGNGGGYGYGIMGPTHHTLEDIAVMRVLPNMKVYVPLTASDVEEAVKMMARDASPNYLRLNMASKLGMPIESFKPWRKLKNGHKAIAIGTGPVIANLLEISDKDLLEEIEIWYVSQLPISELPEELITSIKEKRKVITMEEHYGQCGLKETIADLILRKADRQISYKSIYALGYPAGESGSQKWYQEQSGLAGEGLIKNLKELVHD